MTWLIAVIAFIVGSCCGVVLASLLTSVCMKIAIKKLEINAKMDGDKDDAE